MICSFILSSTLIPLIVSIYGKYFRKGILPPGPGWWSILANHKFIFSPEIWKTFLDMKKYYGPIFSYRIGSRLTVVLNSPDIIKEAFVVQGTTFAGRPYPWTMKLADVHEELNNGDYTADWVAKKNIALRALSKYAGSVNFIDTMLTDEIKQLCEFYDSKVGAVFDARENLSAAMANIIFFVMVSERFSYGDPKCTHMLSLIHEWQNKVGSANMLDLFPFIRYIPAWGPLTDLRKVKKRICEEYRALVLERKRTYEEGAIRDVIDVYLKEYGVEYDTDKLIGLFFSFVGDTVDSLMENLVWTLLYLAYYQEAQNKLRCELKQVLGDNQPCLSQRTRLPYCSAFIMESLRMASFVPVSEPHKTIQDCTLCGYFIPKDSVVLANLYASHYDADYWGDPCTFRPERFLDETGQRIQSDPAFVAFSSGKRRCIGEQLSNKVLFLFVTSLLIRFEVSLESRDSCLLEAIRGYNRKAPDFSVILQYNK